MNTKKSTEAHDIEVRFARGHIVDRPNFDRLVDTVNNIHYGRNEQNILIRHDLNTDTWFVLNSRKTEFTLAPAPQQFRQVEFRKADLLHDAGWMDTLIDWVVKPGIGAAGQYALGHPQQVTSAAGAILSAGAYLGSKFHR